MRFRETAKIQTVYAGGKICFHRGTGYEITLANGRVKIYKPRELKNMSEESFVKDVLELDPSTVKMLETEDRRTPPRFPPKSPERAAEVKARLERTNKRKAKKASQTETITFDVTNTNMMVAQANQLVDDETDDMFQ